MREDRPETEERRKKKARKEKDERKKELDGGDEEEERIKEIIRRNTQTDGKANANLVYS